MLQLLYSLMDGLKKIRITDVIGIVSVCVFIVLVIAIIFRLP